MTAGKTDRPAAGHILRYVYLFEEEFRRGRDEGVKERFVVVVGVDGSRYLVAAITTKGEGRKDAIVIPDEIARTSVAGACLAQSAREFVQLPRPQRLPRLSG